MVKLNNFGVEILSISITKEFSENQGNYVALESGSEYKLKLINDRSTICDVKISIDGEYIGTWRINANSSIILERPLSEERKFTFFAETSKEARNAGIIPNKDSGLISVTFIPKKYVPVYASPSKRQFRHP